MIRFLPYPSRKKLVRLAKKLRRLNFRDLLGSRKFRVNAFITTAIVILMVFLGVLITEKEEKPKEIYIEIKKAPEVRVAVRVPKKVEKEKVGRYEKRPRVAIILDDAGGKIPDYPEIFSIKQPLTISVIPHLPWSGKIAEDAVNNSFEVMLHLPMEPENGMYVYSNGKMVLVSMPEDEIKRIVLDGLGDIKWAVGVNNHMGSRATKNRRVMSAVMDAIKGKEVYFVDSRTTDNSVVIDTARKSGILSASNNVFLDGGTDRSSVESKLKELIYKARVHGEAVGIGHATRSMTIKVLKELMPVYASSGINFVYASELVR